MREQAAEVVGVIDRRTGPCAARLADLLGDTEAGHFDVVLALVAALRATVMTARGEQPAHR